MVIRPDSKKMLNDGIEEMKLLDEMDAIIEQYN